MFAIAFRSWLIVEIKQKALAQYEVPPFVFLFSGGALSVASYLVKKIRFKSRINCCDVLHASYLSPIRMCAQWLAPSWAKEMDEANEIFSSLMGDDVAPRREFIETNALDVANLDV